MFVHSGPCPVASCPARQNSFTQSVGPPALRNAACRLPHVQKNRIGSPESRVCSASAEQPEEIGASGVVALGCTRLFASR